ncbi:hypothetical protein J7384_15605 [Endozoicomonas sp. G2_1]|uniref:hypothetical protein n=1 Tax=Endozoicomonas sp. G2_1 TaxID=2821091 RepID=UPI001AD95A35|nr:hypothetical protein [Endozoicomonas sp. G2_1]MBO9491785.1 hypothetical protein [Endozoicomonas sp. G2_1]
MKKAVITSIAMATSLLASGCATILTEDEHKINVSTSTGQEVTVQVDGKSFQAPGIVSVKKEKNDKVLVTDAEGCTKQTNLNKEVEPTFFVNILSGGAFGSTTDYASDKMWKYQDSVTITCKQ